MPCDVRQAEVQDDDVRSLLLGQSDSLRAVPGLGDDLEPAVEPQRGADQSSNLHDVVDEQHTDAHDCSL